MNIIAASAVMAPPPFDANMTASPLPSRGVPWPRLASAAVLMPLALAAAWFGGWIFNLLVMTMAGLMLWEWVQVSAIATETIVAGGAAAALFVALLSAGLGVLPVGLAIVVLVATGLIVLAGRAGLWAGLGLAYLGLPTLAVIWLRQHPEHGRELIFWLLATVWAVDIGAYAVGRAAGGPKLAPAISPNKTWSGLIGGVIAAGVTSAAVAAVFAPLDLVKACLLGALCAVIAQAGDLTESTFKRRFNVKDAGQLIPGHGGVLDRLDGMLFAAPLLAILVLLARGMPPWR